MSYRVGTPCSRASAFVKTWAICGYNLQNHKKVCSWEIDKIDVKVKNWSLTFAQVLTKADILVIIQLTWLPIWVPEIFRKTQVLHLWQLCLSFPHLENEFHLAFRNCQSHFEILGHHASLAEPVIRNNLNQFQTNMLHKYKILVSANVISQKYFQIYPACPCASQNG